MRDEFDDDVADGDRKPRDRGRGARARLVGRSASSRGPMDARPMQLLDERFARGEIDAEEYEGRRQILEGPR